MSVTRLNEKLNALLSKNSIEKNDFLDFVKTLSALSKGIQNVKKLLLYGPVVKDWISAFQKIFGKHKTDREVSRYINKLSTTMTGVYLKLSQIFHQYERDYTQHFYWRWKQMISVMNASKRASSFIRNVNQFKHTVTHLRTAQLRCEQLAILKVLNLYIERVPQSELNKFKEHVLVDDVCIIDGLIQLKQQPSSIAEHAFLHRISSMGDSILSFQPTKIICAYLALEYTIEQFEMWIDFNLKDKSIMFVAQPVSNDANQCIAIVPDPKLKECVINGEQLIIVKGLWSICTVPEVSQLEKKFSVTIFFPTHLLNMTFESQVRSVFKIKSKTNSSCDESSSIGVHSKQTRTKWRNNLNVLLPSPSYYDNERISDAPSGRSQFAGSLEFSTIFLSSDQSVMDWKKSSCERLSADGQQNRELLLPGTDLEDDLIRDDAKNECIKDTVMKLMEENEKLSTNQARKKDGEDGVQEANTNDKFENLIKKGHLAGDFDDLVKDKGKAENIKDTVTEEKTVEDNEKQSTNQFRKEDDQITKGSLVIPLALDDDYQSSGLSFRDNMSHEEYTDGDIDNVHNKSLNIYSVPQNPLIGKIAPLRNRNENINTFDMPKALQQLGIDYDSSESFGDNESFKETYDTFENLIKNYHLTDNEQMLTSTPRRYYDTKIKSGASSFNEQKESNLKLAENSLNDTNQLPKTDNTQHLQPLLSVASDNLSIVDENHFVPSNLIESHDRNENGNADSSLISPRRIYQTVAINESEPREIFSNRNASDTEMVQNTSRRIYDAKIKTSGASSFNKRKESNLKLTENSLNDTNQMPKTDPLFSVTSDNLSIVDENHFVPSTLIESHDRNENDNALTSPTLINQSVAINASIPREIFSNRNASDTEMVQNTSRRIYDAKIKTSGASSFNKRKESNLKLTENSLNDTNQMPKTDIIHYFQPLFSVTSDNLSIVDDNHFVPSTLIESHDRNENDNALTSPTPINESVAINASIPREIFPNRNVSDTKMVQNTVPDITTRGLEALHPNRNDGKPHDNPYAFLLPDRPISKRKLNSKKVTGKKTVTTKVVFEFPKQKRGKSDETNKAMATIRRRIRNISLLFEHDTAPKLKKSVDKIMAGPKSEVKRNTSNERRKASTTLQTPADSTAVGKEKPRSSIPNYSAKKPKIEILSVVDLGVLHQSSQIMSQRDDQQVFCNVPSCNALLNNLNKFTLIAGACKQHEHYLAQFAKGLQSIYLRVDAVNTHSAAV